MLVVDASALVAIGLAEPEEAAFEEILGRADAIAMTPVNVTEAGLALVLRRAVFSKPAFMTWLAAHDVAEVDIDGGEALEAYLTFGKGVHRAGLNLGDCYAYALAKKLDAPLLFKGDDFTFTDVKRAFQPT